ncbi:MAG TPA: protein kinase [Gemmatimonadales bacterium]|nr:protein kinase [Gemmatimonadales bacterium]
MENTERLTTALAGRYAIEHELGHGGMATVYLARDLKYDRPVALKVLRPELTAALGAERFLREVRISARLDHPHILTLIDSGESDGFLWYVLPYVHGESLREALNRERQLELGRALTITRQIAGALDYAHRQGVIHRDIKPENILLHEGEAMLADFGIAVAVREAGGNRLTESGLSLGTPQYMSPEQATGERELDARSDVYSLGAVLYEMLTGEPPHTGATMQAVIAKLLTERPTRVRTVRDTVPEGVDNAVAKALAKVPADRFHGAAEFAAALDVRGAVARATLPRSLKWALGTAGLVIVGAVIMILARPRQLLMLGEVTPITFEPGLEIEPSISPDGKLVAYAAGPLSRTMVYVRRSGSRPVALTSDSGPPQRRPLWSPDGARILFETDEDLFLVNSLGGVPHMMVHRACCAAWSPDGRQVAYVGSPRRPGSFERPESIFVRPPDGGAPRFVAVVFDPHSLAWSPDGKWLALVSGNDQFAVGTALFGNTGPSAIVLVPPAGGAPVPVTDNTKLNVSPAWAPDSRHLLFVSDREGARDVYAVRLGSSGMPAGPPARITTGLNAHSISISAAAGRLAYSVYTSRANVWTIAIPTDGPVSVDRATQITMGNQTVEQMTLSPDGRWLYFDSNRSGNADIYRMPVDGGEPEQLTTDPADDFGPDISPDGHWMALYSTRAGNRDIFVMPVDGGEAQHITDDPGEERFPAWSPDGRSLSYTLTGADARDGLYVISLDASGRWGTPRQVWNKANLGRWSPDGRALLSAWTDGVWLIPAAGGPARRASPPPETVSDREAPWAYWSRDGRTIYCKSRDRAGRSLIWGVAATGEHLHTLVRFDDPARPSYYTSWTSDGRRFYFTINDRQSDIWIAELNGLK